MIYGTDGRSQVKQYVGMFEQTLSALSESGASTRSTKLKVDEVVLLLECDRPLAGSTRCRIDTVDSVLLGRGSSRGCERASGALTLRVPDARMSARHATINREGHAWVVRDEGSKNGIVVNGRKADRHLLRDGDVVECGRTFFLFKLGRPADGDEPDDVHSSDWRDVPGGLATFHDPLATQIRALPEIARASIPVLVLGPSGSGKELVARAIHELSRRSGAFVPLNCGALPENLVEAELFGARRGAFTGATEDKRGLVRASDEGTLFLDEIGDLPLRAQPALLRVLQEREVLSVGSTRAASVDLRVVAATHRNLDEMVDGECFRADLLARLSGFVLRLPPLNERLEDLGLLIATLLARHAVSDTTLSPDAVRLLLRYRWPLNVRELEHCLRGALAVSPTRIGVEHLPRSIREPGNDAPTSPRVQRQLTPEQVVRRQELCSLLQQHGRNISAVARHLGKDRVQIRRWIRQLDIVLEELAG